MQRPDLARMFEELGDLIAKLRGSAVADPDLPLPNAHGGTCSPGEKQRRRAANKAARRARRVHRLRAGR